MTLSSSPTLPDAPAVYVTTCDVAPPVIAPFVIDHEYELSPGGPPAVLPVEFAQTCAGVGLMTGPGPLQSTSLKQSVASFSAGVCAMSVVARKALYSR